MLLSTCHSLRRSLAEGCLLDYLVIDEASQLDLLAAAPALACCRNLVVVGDLQQLAHIDTGAADGLIPPAAAYDARRHSILASLIELYGAELPRTLLREHYRCDPAIIGFCNRMFYDGRLLPFTTGRGERPMVVVPTVAGNHMRRHRDGGRTNQRELDVIVEQVVPQYCQGVADADIGITTPYRRQVDKAVDVLDLQFVDDARLVNVAVSRAVERFILVTDHGLLPASRYLKDLIGYIRYQDPGLPLPESSVISVFDLLYQEYSDKLLPLARRLRGESRYKSENIIDSVLAGLLEEEQYRHLIVGRQVLLQNLLSDLDGLTARQEAYVRHRASLDFVVYNRVTNIPTLALEENGFAFHENNPQQRARTSSKPRSSSTADCPCSRCQPPEAARRPRSARLLTPPRSPRGAGRPYPTQPWLTFDRRPNQRRSPHSDDVAASRPPDPPDPPDPPASLDGRGQHPRRP